MRIEKVVRAFKITCLVLNTAAVYVSFMHTLLKSFLHKRRSSSLAQFLMLDGLIPTPLNLYYKVAPFWAVFTPYLSLLFYSTNLSFIFIPLIPEWILIIRVTVPC